MKKEHKQLNLYQGGLDDEKEAKTPQRKIARPCALAVCRPFICIYADCRRGGLQYQTCLNGGAVI